MKKLKITSITVLIVTTVLYYLELPIQIKYPIKQIFVIAGFLNIFALFFLLFNTSSLWIEKLNKISKGLIVLVIILIVIHNGIWTYFKFYGPDYKDLTITQIDKENPNRLRIEQHLDYGVFGDYYREIEVYELNRYIRFIEKSED